MVHIDIGCVKCLIRTGLCNQLCYHDDIALEYAIDAHWRTPGHLNRSTGQVSVLQLLWS